MKVLITLTYYWPYISGLTEYAKNLAEGLAARNYKVTVLSMKYAQYLKRREKMHGVEIVRANKLIKINKGFLSIDWVWQSIKMVSQSEIVIVNLPEPEAVITAIITKFCHKKLIAIYHCDVVTGNCWLDRIVDGCNNLIMEWADKIVTNTSDYANSSRVLPRFLEKIKYIYPIIKIKGIQHKRNKKLVIGWLGRMAREKGIEYLLESIPYLEKKDIDFKILLAGPTWTAGEDKYQIKIKQLINNYSPRVEQSGQLDEERLKAFYKSIDILVLPSVEATETLGMVQMEAMNAGIPTVASDLPGVRQPIIKTGMGEVVAPRSSKELAEALFKVYKNYDKYKQQKEKAKNLFDPEKGLDEYEQLILS